METNTNTTTTETTETESNACSCGSKEGSGRLNVRCYDPIGCGFFKTEGSPVDISELDAEEFERLILAMAASANSVVEADGADDPAWRATRDALENAARAVRKRLGN